MGWKTGFAEWLDRSLVEAPTDSIAAFNINVYNLQVSGERFAGSIPYGIEASPLQQLRLINHLGPQRGKALLALVRRRVRRSRPDLRSTTTPRPSSSLVHRFVLVAFAEACHRLRSFFRNDHDDSSICMRLPHSSMTLYASAETGTSYS